MTNFDFKHDTTRYEPANALSLGKAASLAYKDEGAIGKEVAAWGFDKFRFFSRRETQAFTMANDQAVITAFRGTEPDRLRDWMTDIDLNLVSGPGGRVHDGFQRALGRVYPDIRRTLSEYQRKGQSLWFTGHSLGAALAALAVASLIHDEDRPVYGLYTYGQPRTGDRDFAQSFNREMKARTFRFVNNNDAVTRVPPREFGYSHAGTFLYFDVDGHLHSDISWWYRLLDRVTGRIEDFLAPGTDGVKDHAMDRYLKNLEKNRNVKPKF